MDTNRTDTKGKYTQSLVWIRRETRWLVTLLLASQHFHMLHFHGLEYCKVKKKQESTRMLFLHRDCIRQKMDVTWFKKFQKGASKLMRAIEMYAWLIIDAIMTPWWTVPILELSCRGPKYLLEYQIIWNLEQACVMSLLVDTIPYSVTIKWRQSLQCAHRYVIPDPLLCVL